MRHGYRPWRRTALGAALATATLLAITALPATAEGQVRGVDNPAAIKDSYLVVYKSSVPRSAVDATTGTLAGKYGASVDYTYRNALRGFAGTFGRDAARRLAAEADVEYVQQNGRVRAIGTQANPPSWGLDRIDQASLPLNSAYTYPNNATNVTAYIIDTGIRVTHQDFGGRAAWGTNTTGDLSDTDCNGHGTHVAGTVGGTTFGVAKNVKLVAVKVLGCDGSGTLAGVAAGIDWVTGDHSGGAAVANLSLGATGTDTTLENAVRASIADGVTYAIAAGNNNADACGFTPARVAEAITAGASDTADNRASFSNFGTCVDLFAPGVNITSAWNAGDTASSVLTGTSMSAPHVAGAAAVLLGADPSLTPARVASTLTAEATPNKIVNPGTGSPNRLLFVSNAARAGVPVVTNPGNKSGAAGSAVNLALTATGGTQPYTWSATGLPNGLAINALTGQITGTLTTAGVSTVTVTVTDALVRTGQTTFTWTVLRLGGCTGEKLLNPGFESGQVGWVNGTSTINQWDPAGPGAPRTGTWSSWIGGYGFARTETLDQTVAIPAGCTSYLLSLNLKIITDEVGSTVFDTLTVRIGSTVLATYSNVNASPYTPRSFNVAAFAGQNVAISFTGSEDSSVQTSFVLDDLSLTTS